MSELRSVEEISRESGGYAVESRGAIYIPAIMAPGRGSAFLDALPRDVTIKVPCVISLRLERMLRRRGFVQTWEWAEEFGEVVEVFVRWAARRPTCSLPGANRTGQVEPDGEQ